MSYKVIGSRPGRAPGSNHSGDRVMWVEFMILTQRVEHAVLSDVDGSRTSVGSIQQGANSEGEGILVRVAPGEPEPCPTGSRGTDG